MVLVRVAHLSDLQVPSDQVGSKMHYPASEVLPQKRAGSTGVAFSGLAVANDGTARCDRCVEEEEAQKKSMHAENMAHVQKKQRLVGISGI